MHSRIPFRTTRASLMLALLLALPGCDDESDPITPTLPSFQLAFSGSFQGDTEIFIAELGGGPPTTLTNVEGISLGHYWSPDGSRLAFVSDREGDFEIYVLELESSVVTRLTHSPGPDLSPIWSPDGGRIAFLRGFDQLHVMNADGSDQRLLAEIIESDHTNHSEAISWSPDGQRLVFVGGTNLDPDLFLIQVTGGPAQRLRDPGLFESTPAWSPDGSAIAFAASDTEGALDVYRMAADGTGRARLTFDGRNLSPAWSPASDVLAFISFRTGEGDVYAMTPQGGGQRRVSAEPGLDRQPAWSPDGSLIAFATQAGRIVVASPTTGGRPTLVGPPTLQAATPLWRPEPQ